MRSYTHHMHSRNNLDNINEREFQQLPTVTFLIIFYNTS